MQTTFPYDIPAGEATIRVLGETLFEIHDFAAVFTPYYVPDTRDLDTIVKALQNRDWNEDHINAAVDALNAKEEALAAQEWPVLAGTLAGDRFP